MYDELQFLNDELHQHGDIHLFFTYYWKVLKNIRVNEFK